MNSEEWDKIAEWYDRKMGDEGDLWHRHLIDLTFFKVIGDVGGKRILDLGCGNGCVGRKLARLGGVVTAIDASPEMIRRARKRGESSGLSVEYLVCDAADLSIFKDGRFDLVVSNMALMDIEDASRTITETYRVLRAPGRFVFSISHPCFDIGDASAWVIERAGVTTTVWRKVSRYRESFAHRVKWRVDDHRMLETTTHHRALSWYFRQLAEQGFVVTSFEEPAPSEEFIAESPQGPWIAEIPLHCVIEARKFEV